MQQTLFSLVQFLHYSQMDTTKTQHLFWAVFLLTIGSVHNCGYVVNLNTKIIGGEHVNDIWYPWFAVFAPRYNIFSRLAQFCGGSLITEKDVLVAAHCIVNADNSDFAKYIAVYFGVQNKCYQWHQSERVLINKYAVHPEFNPILLSNDIAIVTLQRKTSYEPICLPKPKSKLPPSGEVIGFGVSKKLYGLYASYCQLQRVELPRHGRNVCNSIYGNLHGRAFCAGDLSGNKDSCQGDSGGPFQNKDKDNQYTIYGIVSYGIQCALKDSLGVYIDVRFYLKWILSNIEQ